MIHIKNSLQKFFVPPGLSIQDEKIESFVENSISPFIKLTTNRTINKNRIYRITYFHDGKTITNTIGDMLHGEIIHFILESEDMFFVLTYNRGIKGGIPILIGKHHVEEIEIFINDH